MGPHQIWLENRSVGDQALFVGEDHVDVVAERTREDVENGGSSFRHDVFVEKQEPGGTRCFDGAVEVFDRSTRVIFIMRNYHGEYLVIERRGVRRRWRYERLNEFDWK